TLTVRALSNNTGTYQFQLLDLDTATPLTPGTAISAALNPTNATAAYQFTTNAGDRFFFDLTTPGIFFSGGPNLRVVDPYGNSILSTSFPSGLKAMNLAQGGTYEVLVEGTISNTSAVSYTLNVQPVTDPAPVALPLGSTVSGSVAAPGQQVRYT